MIAQDQLDFFQWTRVNTLELLDQMTIEQVNVIPLGFKNNIIWNAGHVHISQQVLVYKLSGLPMDASDSFFKEYVSGSSPKPWVDQDEFDHVKACLRKYAELTVTDYQQGRFKDFEPFSANYFSVDYHFTRFETSFQYNNLHEALHLGYMRSLLGVLEKSNGCK